MSRRYYDDRSGLWLSEPGPRIVLPAVNNPDPRDVEGARAYAKLLEEKRRDKIILEQLRTGVQEGSHYYDVQSWQDHLAEMGTGLVDGVAGEGVIQQMLEILDHPIGREVVQQVPGSGVVLQLLDAYKAINPPAEAEDGTRVHGNSTVTNVREEGRYVKADVHYAKQRMVPVYGTRGMYKLDTTVNPCTGLPMRSCSFTWECSTAQPYKGKLFDGNGDDDPRRLNIELLRVLCSHVGGKSRVQAPGFKDIPGDPEVTGQAIMDSGSLCPRLHYHNLKIRALFEVSSGIQGGWNSSRSAGSAIYSMDDGVLGPARTTVGRDTRAELAAGPQQSMLSSMLRIMILLKRKPRVAKRAVTKKGGGFPFQFSTVGDSLLAEHLLPDFVLSNPHTDPINIANPPQVTATKSGGQQPVAILSDLAPGERDTTDILWERIVVMGQGTSDEDVKVINGVCYVDTEIPLDLYDYTRISDDFNMYSGIATKNGTDVGTDTERETCYRPSLSPPQYLPKTHQLQLRVYDMGLVQAQVKLKMWAETQYSVL